ncbi:MAG: GNAT family N-acetyltransferase [Actinobacteria bacterium]|nr:GNAT family N-acetyltransferase [Actinomycetota bacterium]
MAGTLADAFYDDPVAEWIFPDDDLRRRILPRVYTVDVAQAQRNGEVWTTDRRDAAALWMPPGHWRMPLRDELRMLRASLHPGLLPRVPAIVRGFMGVESQHPQRPHWYLSDLGVAPSAQGQGLGATVVAPVLGRCDEQGVGAYLESSKEANVPFYEGRGFKVTGEYDLPRGGPRLYLMWRDPQ